MRIGDDNLFEIGCRGFSYNRLCNPIFSYRLQELNRLLLAILILFRPKHASITPSVSPITVSLVQEFFLFRQKMKFLTITPSFMVLRLSKEGGAEGERFKKQI